MTESLRQDWIETTLGAAPLQIIDGDRGKNYPSQDHFTTSGYCLFLSTKNVHVDGFNFADCQFISKESDELLRKGRLERDDLVLTTRGTVGNIGFFNNSVKLERIRINSGMVIIRPNKDKLFPKFNYYVFRKLQKDFDVFISGSAQPQLPIRDLNQIEISLPPLPEQQAIAEILSSLDDKIDLLNRQNKTLEALAETLFRQWFIEEADEAWEEGCLGDYIKISSGKTLNRSEFNDNGQYEILGANGSIGKTNYFLKDEKVIYTGRVGTLGNIFINQGKAWYSDNTLIFNVINDNFYYYLYFFLKEIGLKNYNVGSTQPLIRQGDIKNILFDVPQENILNLFDTLCVKQFQKILENSKQIQTLKSLRDTLLPKLMSGDVRVRMEAIKQIQAVA